MKQELFTLFSPGSTIGMLGGGQLGRMATFCAKQMGYNVITLEPKPNSPCGQVADDQLTAPYDDEAALTELAQRCDVITYEFENVPDSSVRLLSALGATVFPGADLLAVAQSRVQEKLFARRAGLATADFQAVDTLADLELALEEVGLPGVLKTDSGGYDGKGQAVVSRDDEARLAFMEFQGQTLIYEQKIDFAREVSVIVARNQTGAVAVYPLTENIHTDNILTASIVPARVPAAVVDEARQIAITLAEAIKLVGVCAIELFLLPDERLLVNEIAPRPHNSGHHTIESCVCSQFEQQIRAVCGLPLGSTELLSAAAMVNILGDGQGNRLAGVEQILQTPNVHLHLYGKAEAKAGRKMGHLTVLTDTPDEALRLATEARQSLRWEA